MSQFGLGGGRNRSCSPHRYGRPACFGPDEDNSTQLYPLSRTPSYGSNFFCPADCGLPYIGCWYGAVDMSAGDGLYSRAGSRATSRAASRAPSVSRYDYSIVSSSANVESPFRRASNFPRSRAATPVGGLDTPPRASSRSRQVSPVPSYSEALCRVSKRLRQRSLPPPAPPPKHEFSLPRPSAYTTVGKSAPVPRVVASDYYKKYIKSVYEREPMFKEFFDSVPPAERNFYNSQSLEKMKRDFRGLCSDQWDRKQAGDPSVDHDLARKVHPWGSYASRRPDGETASERLWRIQSRPMEGGDPPLPRVTIYHRSTWTPQRL